MLSQPLFATLLAAAPLAVPTSVEAFGELDCIGIEICTVDGCAPSEVTFNVTYIEATRSVALTVDDQPDPRIFGDSDFDPDAPLDTAFFVHAETRAILHIFWDTSVRIGLTQDGAIHYAACTAPAGAV